jgi:hypothetical protein
VSTHVVTVAGSGAVKICIVVVEAVSVVVIVSVLLLIVVTVAVLVDTLVVIEDTTASEIPCLMVDVDKLVAVAAVVTVVDFVIEIVFGGSRLSTFEQTLLVIEEYFDMILTTGAATPHVSRRGSREPSCGITDALESRPEDRSDSMVDIMNEGMTARGRWDLGNRSNSAARLHNTARKAATSLRPLTR